MRSRAFLLLALPLAAVGITSLSSAARPPQGDKIEEAKNAIAKNGELFIEAYHSGDAKAVAAFWAEDGDYTEPGGRTTKGRAAIEKSFADMFGKNKGLKLRINSETLRFLTPDVAVEDGTTEVIPPDAAPPSRARYSIVHVQKDGKWYLGSVRDSHFVPATNYEHFQDLERVIGDWAEDAAGGEILRKSFSWSDNQGFIVTHHSVAFKNTILSSGTQWIGWDPMDKRLRSWTFDGNGGFGEGTWTKDGDKWIIKTTGLQQDGKKVTAAHILGFLDPDTMTWQTKDRAVDGKPLPDTKEVKLKRLK
jgi:uncharacterized protein (TIGR02246 family)